MTVVRFLLATVCAGFLAGCAAHVPILDEGGDAAASQDAQVFRGAATTTPPVTQNMKVVQAPDGDGLAVVDPRDADSAAPDAPKKKRKVQPRKSAAISSNVSNDLKKPVQGSATRSAKASARQSDPESIADYAERAKRKAEEDERKERNLKKEINGICSGC